MVLKCHIPLRYVEAGLPTIDDEDFDWRYATKLSLKAVTAKWRDIQPKIRADE